MSCEVLGGSRVLRPGGGLLVTCYLLLFSGKACGKSMGHEVRLDLVEHHAGNTCVRARGLAGKKVHQGARHPWVAGMERNGPSPCGTSPEYGIPGTSHPRARAPSDCADLRCSGRFVAPSSGSTVSGQRHLHKRKSRTNTDEQLSRELPNMARNEWTMIVRR